MDDLGGKPPIFEHIHLEFRKKNDGKNPKNLQQDPRSTDPEKKLSI